MLEQETLQQLQDIEYAIREGDASAVVAFDNIKKSIDDLAKKLKEQQEQQAEWREEDKAADVPDTSNPYATIEAKLDSIIGKLDALINKLPPANRLYAAIIMAGCLSTEKDWAKMDSDKFNSDGDLNKMFSNISRFVQKVNNQN